MKHIVATPSWCRAIAPNKGRNTQTSSADVLHDLAEVIVEQHSQQQQPQLPVLTGPGEKQGTGGGAINELVAELGATPAHVLFQLGPDRVIERRWLIVSQRLGADLAGPGRRVLAAELEPALVVGC